MTIRSSAALAVPNITETEDDGLNANYHGDPPMSSRQSPRHALDTDEHRAGRVIRGVDWVVWVETAEAKWIELDAHSAINAETLRRIGSARSSALAAPRSAASAVRPGHIPPAVHAADRFRLKFH